MYKNFDMLCLKEKMGLFDSHTSASGESKTGPPTTFVVCFFFFVTEIAAHMSE